MSTNATFGQAGHTLTIIGQQEPTTEHLLVLHDGYLADLVRAIKNGSLPARQDFQKFLGLLPEFKIWKTIKLGLHGSADEYRQAIKANGNRIGDYANQILDKISVATTEIEIDLAVVTVADLGFKQAARYDAICARAKEIGFQLCPNEVGPALRLGYQDQPNGEWLRIAMEPLAASDGVLDVFYVGRDYGARWLDADCGRPVSTWGSDGRFVFALPRKYTVGRFVLGHWVGWTCSNRSFSFGKNQIL